MAAYNINLNIISKGMKEIMRLRNIPGSKEFIAESNYVVHDPENRKGHWNEVFGNNNPIHIEIGMGKGKFITGLAKRNPDINYIGIEKYSSVLIRAIEKRDEDEELKNIKNLTFIRFDAEEITEIFDTDEIDRIYLNFSDPWPKDRHAKRRLTSSKFLERYDTFLKKEGHIAFKTDNRALFDFSLEEIKNTGWTLSDVTFDLHNSEYNEGNIMTEYEEKFSSMGNPIHRLVASR